MHKIVSDPKRLATANEALEAGDISLACIIYTRLALSRRRSPSTEEAKRKILELQQRARRELDDVEVKLHGGQQAMSRSITALKPKDDGWLDRLTQACDEYDELARRYAHLPALGGRRGEIALQVNRLRSRYATDIAEAQARTLWALGQQYERQGHQCCAYLVYQEAMELTPAPSAELARQRFETLDKDPEVVASSVTCREVQWCLAAYLRAEQQLAEGHPDRAQAICRQILERAPHETEVYRAAKEWVENGKPEDGTT